ALLAGLERSQCSGRHQFVLQTKLQKFARKPREALMHCNRGPVKDPAVAFSHGQDPQPTCLTLAVCAAPLTRTVFRIANADLVGGIGCDGGSSLRWPVVWQRGHLRYARNSRRCRSSATSAVDRTMPKRQYACHSLRHWKERVSRLGATLQSSIAS